EFQCFGQQLRGGLHMSREAMDRPQHAGGLRAQAAIVHIGSLVISANCGGKCSRKIARQGHAEGAFGLCRKSALRTSFTSEIVGSLSEEDLCPVVAPEVP